MLRQVIIIAAPGNREKTWVDQDAMMFYTGVCRDLTNFENFYSSPLGGAFVPKEEIISFINPTWRELKACLQKREVDYTVVVYTGHGYTERPKGIQRLNINDKEQPSIEEIVKQIKSKRILFIVDACRIFIDDEESRYYGVDGSGTPAMQFTSNVDEITARLALEHYVRGSQEGIQYLFSSGPDEKSFLTHDGSIFSRLLLLSTQEWAIKNSAAAVLRGIEAYNTVRKRMRDSTGEQNPKIICREGVDFPLGIKQPLPVLRNGFYERY